MKEYIQKEANGRLVKEIELFKYPNESLGFSVIGLRSDYRGDLGIFVNVSCTVYFLELYIKYKYIKPDINCFI